MLELRNFRENSVTESLARGGMPVGAFIQIAAPEIVEIAGDAGYDYVWIDCEHGSFYLETVVSMIRAAEAVNITPIVRVPDHSSSFIMKVLDAGAAGIVVPHVTNQAEAEGVVAAAKFPSTAWPQGKRSNCPLVRAAGHQATNWDEFADRSNERTIVWILIESLDAVDNLERICEVKGLDAIVPGSFDLSIDMGHGGDRHHSAVVKKVEQMLGTARAKGVDIIGICFDPTIEEMLASKKQYEQQGCRIFIVGNDRRTLSNSFRSIADQIRE